MTSQLAEPALWSYGLAFVASLAFGIYLLVGSRGAPRGRLVVVAVLLGAPAALAAMGVVMTGADFWWRTYRLTDACRVAAWLAFLATLVRPLENDAARGGRRWVAATVCGVVLLVLAVFLPATPPFSSTPIDIGRDAYAAFLAATIIGLVLVEALYRNASAGARWTIKPILIAVGGAFVFDLFIFADALLFGGLDATLWAARGVVQVLVMPFLAVATVRNRDWTIDIAVSRGVVFHSSALLVVGLYLLVMSAAGYYVQLFGGGWGRLLQVAVIFGGLLLLAFLALSSTARAKLRVYVNKNFFSYRYDYRSEWLRVTNLLSSRDDTAKLNARVIDALADLVESPGGALWLRRARGEFAQVSYKTLAAVDESLAGDSKLARFLERRGWVIDLNEFQKQPGLYEDLELPGWLRGDAGAWLVVPLTVFDELAGFVVLARPRTPIDVNWEVRDLLKSAGRQAASYLAQVQASEALLEAGKFDAFNKMSAFVVHDLKNLAAQLTLLLKNAERHGENPEFRQDMLLTVRHVTDRLNGLLAQLRAGTTPVANAAPVDLTQVVHRIQHMRASRTPRLDVTAPTRLMALGHEDRLERVIGHLVQNAQDATENGQPVTVAIADEAGFAVVTVTDRGIGMTPEFVRDRLFKPFQTTKTAGMGIGAYESAQYVNELGGRIEVDSRPGEGTTVRVYLPRAGIERAKAA